MGTMNVEVPDGATIQVFVGEAPLAAAPRAISEASPPAAPHRKAHPVVTALAAIAILGGGFLLGQHARLSPSASAAQSASLAAPPPVTEAFPNRAPAKLDSLIPPQSPPHSSPAGVPSDFTAQLKKKPTVVPPPGRAPASSTSHKNPFGLGG